MSMNNISNPILLVKYKFDSVILSDGCIPQLSTPHFLRPKFVVATLVYRFYLRLACLLREFVSNRSNRVGIYPRCTKISNVLDFFPSFAIPWRSRAFCVFFSKGRE
jgi:hypothetical protein